MGSNIPGTLATARMLEITVVLAAPQKYEHLQQQRPKQICQLGGLKYRLSFLKIKLGMKIERLEGQ